MNSENCQRYLEDPDAHPAHLDQCEECRMLFGGGDEVAFTPRPMSLDALPIAPWEQASHRSWPLIVASSLALLTIAVMLFLVSGMSPLRGFIDAFRSSVPSAGVLMSSLRMIGGALQHAPSGLQIFIGVAFFVVNGILFLLLRRSPRGVDA